MSPVAVSATTMSVSPRKCGPPESPKQAKFSPVDGSPFSVSQALNRFRKPWMATLRAVWLTMLFGPFVLSTRVRP
jgi:hypothetical protein